MTTSSSPTPSPSPAASDASAASDARADEAAFVARVLETEADAVRSVAGRLDGPAAAAWHEAIDLVTGCTGHLVVSGMGKSGLVGAKISATFSSLGQPSSVLHPAEAVHGDLGRVRRGDVVLLLSWSGETAEVVDLALILKADAVPTIGMSRDDASSLAKACTCHVALGDLPEACPLQLAPTASTTAQLAVGDALALAVARRRDFGADDFHRSHPGGMLGAGLRRITEVIRFRVGTNLAVLPDGGTVREVLDAARASAGGARRAGAILLVDADGRLTGVFTDGDLRRLVVDDLGGLDRPVREVMTVDPKHLDHDALVRDAERLIRAHRVDEIPVVDADRRPVGLVDVQDLIAMKIVRES